MKHVLAAMVTYLLRGLQDPMAHDIVSTDVLELELHDALNRALVHQLPREGGGASILVV